MLKILDSSSIHIACTAVVTELAYHSKQTIDADVSFLSEAEWRAELDILLHDLVDEDGNIKRSTDLKSDAGVAWQKVYLTYCISHAVSPILLSGACSLSLNSARTACKDDY